MNEEIKEIVDRIVYPDELKNLNSQDIIINSAIKPFSEFNVEFYCKFKICDKTNILSILDWLERRSIKLGFGKLNSLNWDDEKEFDFQTEYNIILTFCLDQITLFKKLNLDKSFELLIYNSYRYDREMLSKLLEVFNNFVKNNFFLINQESKID